MALSIHTPGERLEVEAALGQRFPAVRRARTD
jgi:hypothetical protein